MFVNKKIFYWLGAGLIGGTVLLILGIGFVFPKKFSFPFSQIKVKENKDYTLLEIQTGSPSILEKIKAGWERLFLGNWQECYWRNAYFAPQQIVLANFNLAPFADALLEGRFVYFPGFQKNLKKYLSLSTQKEINSFLDNNFKIVIGQKGDNFYFFGKADQKNFSLARVEKIVQEIASLYFPEKQEEVLSDGTPLIELVRKPKKFSFQTKEMLGRSVRSLETPFFSFYLWEEGGKIYFSNIAQVDFLALAKGDNCRQEPWVVAPFSLVKERVPALGWLDNGGEEYNYVLLLKDELDKKISVYLVR